VHYQDVVIGCDNDDADQLKEKIGCSVSTNGVSTNGTEEHVDECVSADTTVQTTCNYCYLHFLVARTTANAKDSSICGIAIAVRKQ
jgi:hypothetical protein